MEHQRLHEAMMAATDYFAAQLDRSQVARDYLFQHGIDSAEAHRAELGYAPTGGGLAALRAEGFDDEALITAGLATRRDDGAVRGFFRHRVVFPIRDTTGLPIAFTARTLSDTRPGPPKWLNTRTTPLFDKGASLLGADDLTEADTVAIVEGAADRHALAALGAAEPPLWQAVISPAGTSLTAEQLALIARTAGPQTGLVFLFDGDAAGAKATERAWRLLAEHGWAGPVSGIDLPAGADPASMVAADPAAAAAHFRARLRPLSVWMTESEIERHRSVDGTYFRPQATAAVRRLLAPTLAAGMNRHDLVWAASMVAAIGIDPIDLLDRLAEDAGISSDELLQAGVELTERGTDPLARHVTPPDPTLPRPALPPSARPRQPRSAAASGAEGEHPESAGDDDPTPIRPAAGLADDPVAERAYLRAIARYCLAQAVSQEDFLAQLDALGAAVRLRHRGDQTSGWSMALPPPAGSGRHWAASTLDSTLTWPRLRRVLPTQAARAEADAAFADLTAIARRPATVAADAATIAKTAPDRPASVRAMRTDTGGRIWVLARPEGDDPNDQEAAETAAAICAYAAPTLGPHAACRLAADAIRRAFGHDSKVSLIAAHVGTDGPATIAWGGRLRAWSLDAQADSLTPDETAETLLEGPVHLASVPNPPAQIVFLPDTARRDTRYSRHWSTAHFSERADPAALVTSAATAPESIGLASAVAGEHTDPMALAAARTAVASARLVEAFGTAMVCTAPPRPDTAGRPVRLFAARPEKLIVATNEPDSDPPPEAPTTEPDAPAPPDRVTAAHLRHLFTGTETGDHQPAGALVTLGKAVTGRQAVTFDYQHEGADQPWTREVEPWACLHWNGNDYLVGYDRRMMTARSFRIDRIAGTVTPTGAPGAFAPPPQPQIAAALTPAAVERRPRRRRPPPPIRRTPRGTRHLQALPAAAQRQKPLGAAHTRPSPPSPSASTAMPSMRGSTRPKASARPGRQPVQTTSPAIRHRHTPPRWAAYQVGDPRCTSHPNPNRYLVRPGPPPRCPTRSRPPPVAPFSPGRPPAGSTCTGRTAGTRAQPTTPSPVHAWPAQSP